MNFREVILLESPGQTGAKVARLAKGQGVSMSVLLLAACPGGRSWLVGALKAEPRLC